MAGISSEELDRRLEIVRQTPNLASALLLIHPGEKGPVCDLCGGTMAPIIDGRHLSPDRFCEIDGEESIR